jgi:hypothetical protein
MEGNTLINKFHIDRNPMGVVKKRILEKLSVGWGWEIAPVVISFEHKSDTIFFMIIHNGKAIFATPDGKHYYMFVSQKGDNLTGKYTPLELLNRLYSVGLSGKMKAGLLDAPSSYVNKIVPNTVSQKTNECFKYVKERLF